MASQSRAEIIRRCFAASASKDRQLLGDLLSDGFRFTSSYDDRIDKAAC
jgi:ketosteroid isomerase-like protein